MLLLLQISYLCIVDKFIIFITIHSNIIHEKYVYKKFIYITNFPVNLNTLYILHLLQE